MEVIGRHGDHSDLAGLRALTDDLSLVANVVKAIEQLDGAA